MKIKTDKIESRAIFVVYFYFFWQTACPVPIRLNLTSQKLVLTKISNKCPFLEVEGMGAYLRVGAYSRGRLFKNLRYFPLSVNLCTIDPFHNNIQFEAKDVIPCAARNLHRIIMLQLHVQNNFMRC